MQNYSKKGGLFSKKSPENSGMFNLIEITTIFKQFLTAICYLRYHSLYQVLLAELFQEIEFSIKFLISDVAPEYRRIPHFLVIIIDKHPVIFIALFQILVLGQAFIV